MAPPRRLRAGLRPQRGRGRSRRRPPDRSAAARPGRTARWAGLVAVAGSVVVLLIASPAAAHSVLLSASPAPGSEVPAGPAAVVLHFSEPVGISAGALAVLDPTGRRVGTGAPVQAAGDPAIVQVALPPGLPAASYAVLWRVVSADGHPVSGAFSFGVGVPAGATPARAAPDVLVGALRTLASWVAYLGAVLLVGVPFFALVVRPAGIHDPRLARLTRHGWRVSVGSAVALVALQGPYGAGLGMDYVADADLLGDTLTGRPGLLMIFRLFVLGLAAAAGPWPGAESIGGLRRNAAGLAVLFLPTFGLLGHSGAGPLAGVAAAATSLHLAAAGVWLGGLAALLVTLSGVNRAGAADGAGSPSGADRGTAPADPPVRWPVTAAIAVGVLAVTGTYQAVREVPTPGALPGTGYGRLLLAKVAGVAVLLVLAGLARRRLPGRAAGVGAVVAAELGVGAGVLAVTAVLVAAVPASQSYDAPVSVAITARDVEGRPLAVHVTVSPTRAGQETFRLTVTDSGGRPSPVIAATGTLEARGRGIGPIRFAFPPDGAGRVRAVDVAVPTAGSWSLTVQVRTDLTRDYSGTLTYPVR
ncbi:MAG TPA: copper resistance protein CopC [Kineosporiaceae bacterium]